MPMWLHNTLQKLVKELLKADSASSIYQKELLKELQLQNRGRHVGIVTDVVKDIFPNVAFHENRTGVMRSRASDSPRPPNSTDDEAAVVLRDADQNQDGMLSLAEFREAWKKKESPMKKVIHKAGAAASMFLSSKAGAAVMAAIAVKGIDVSESLFGAEVWVFLKSQLKPKGKEANQSTALMRPCGATYDAQDTAYAGRGAGRLVEADPPIELSELEAESSQAAQKSEDGPEVCGHGLIDFDDLVEAEHVRQEEAVTSCKRRCIEERARKKSREVKGRGIGIHYGLALPASPAELLTVGAHWLSRAFWQAKTLPEDQTVSQVIALRPLTEGAHLLEVLLTGGVTMLAVTFFKESRDIKVLSGVLKPRTSVGSFVHGINFLRLLESELKVAQKFFFGDVCDHGSAGIIITEWSEMSTAPLCFCPSTWDLLPQRQSCFLSPVDHQELCLAGSAQRFGDPALGLLGLCLKPSEKEMWHQKSWTLVHVEEGLWQLRNSDGLVLLASNASAEALHLRMPSMRRHEMWRIYPAGPKAPDAYYIQSYYETFLAYSLAGNAVFMCATARSNAQWSLATLAEMARKSSPLHRIDLRGPRNEGLSFHMMERLIIGFAELAGRCVTQNVALDNMPEESDEKASSDRYTEHDDTADAVRWRELRVLLRHQLARLQHCDSPRAQLGFQDSEFLDKASVAQEFIARLAVQLFSGTINKQAMKDYRAALVTARVNYYPICAFLTALSEYHVCGPEVIGVDSLYEDFGCIGMQNLGDITCGPLGLKLWRWLCLAAPKVLSESFGHLIELFVKTLAANCDRHLDSEKLMWHVLLAASLHSVELLDAVPILLERIPKSEWFNIRSWSDPRLSSADTWMAMKGFASIAIVTTKFDLVNRMVHDIPEVLSTHQVICNTIFRDGAKPWQPVLIGLGDQRTEVRAAASWKSEILALLPADFPAFALEPEHPEGWAEICMPFNGYIPWASSRLCDASEVRITKDNVPASMEILSLMYHTRRQYTGKSGPMFMDEISAKKLCDEIYLREKASNLLARLGHGQCSVVHGSFLADTERKPWWPEEYKDWAYHSFVLFDDGHIADLTADQFDISVPQLWYPADPSRYDRSSHRAEEARFLRQVTIGLDKWRQFVEQDRHASGLLEKTPRPLYDWWDAEMKGGFDVRNGQRGQVLRHGKSMPLPEPFDVRQVRDRSVVFRRLTEPEELKVCLVEGTVVDGRDGDRR
ncbi:unnamed protein product [Cladocopium goreaui]|uniref:EF-hand domain-containing protein n=1 Tax=Cladocopium goreaui TaxID=2562237 RepID=A0A9P1FJW7_9DINO|nr:unnamed protein product [Cladocopium goreaui]